VSGEREEMRRGGEKDRRIGEGEGRRGEGRRRGGEGPLTITYIPRQT
jgi:hypothetical protein